ncbi:MAG: adenylosuccinate synthetase [archaeon]
MNNTKQVLECYVGLQWGDEGKGRLVDNSIERAKLINPEKRIVVVRFQGGPNAGHTIYGTNLKGELAKFVTHAAPSGIVGNTDIAIGPDVAFDPEKFKREIDQGRELFGYNGRIMISERVGILFDYHRKIDGWREDNSERKIGTTRNGIGAFYEDNARRQTRITFRDYISDRFHDRLMAVLKLKLDELLTCVLEDRTLDNLCQELISVHDPIRKELTQFSERLEYRLFEDYLNQGNHIIIEGAQGTMLDVNMGTIPDITSSHLLAPNAFSSLGLPRTMVKVIGVEKIYPTRVGEGIMPTEAKDEFGEIVAKIGDEIGATTGRKRRVGYPDWLIVKRSVLLNTCNEIIVTRADVVQGLNLKVCTDYRFDGRTLREVPLDLSSVVPIYTSNYWWDLWGTEVEGNPLHLNQKIEDARAHYVETGIKGLPNDLIRYIADHDRYMGCPITGVGISPKGEIVSRK